MGIAKLATWLVTVALDATPQRPPISGIANIAVKMTGLQAARKFYAGVLRLGDSGT
jgi:hypothetical protein